MPDPSPGRTPARAERIAYAFRSVRIEAEIRATALAPAVRAIFPDYRVPPGEAPPDLLLDAPGRGEGGEGGTAADAFAAFELVLAERFLQGAGALRLHAGAVSGPEGAVLVSGPGGSGKSTLTAGLALRGWPVFGDDVVLLDDTGEVAPFKRLLKVVDPAPSILGLPPPASPLRAVLPGVGLYHPAELGSTWADPAPVTAVVFPRRARVPVEASLVPVSGARAIQALLYQTLLVPAPGSREFELLAGALEGARFFELPFSRSPEALTVLEAELGLATPRGRRPGSPGADEPGAK